VTLERLLSLDRRGTRAQTPEIFMQFFATLVAVVVLVGLPPSRDASEDRRSPGAGGQTVPHPPPALTLILQIVDG